MSLKLSELKQLHEKGLALIYLKPKTKRPFENSWTTMTKKSWDELENSFEKTYNVGVRLGEPSLLKSGKYLGAIDCDVKATSRKALKEMNEKLRELGIDLTNAPIVMSGRGNGSKHIYVQTEKPMRPMKFAQSANKVKVLMPGEDKPHSKKEMVELTPEERAQGYRIRAAWEISFMGTGQQTVLPPSVHPDTGFEYAWSSPLTVKHCPSFKPEAFVRQEKSNSFATSEQEEFKFQATEINLYNTRLSIPMIKLIEKGENCEDRSASLLSVSMAMCRAGLTDNEILSVLSDRDNWIAEAAYEHTQSDSRGRAVRWLRKYTLLKARFETDIMRRFENKPELEPLTKKKVAIEKEKIKDEHNEVLPDLDGNGKPKTSLRNMVHILEHFMDQGLVGFNEFAQRPYFLKDTPYGGERQREITDDDDLALKHYVACHYRFEPSKELCFEAHAFIARKYAYHPVKQYLEGLEWDGTERLDSWLTEAFRASGPRSYLEAVSRKVLCAAVTRVFEPGCKFDYMLVLEGFQGKGKSMSLGMLVGPQWFTDSLGDIHNKDVIDQMIGKWLIEVSELASIRGRENEAVKSFITRQVDRARLSYARRAKDFPRQCIFVGSTNNSEYLTDETGNRRYWPVKIGNINRKWIRDNRDQLWAEAMVRYQLGENLYLPPEVEVIANKEQERRYEVDEWEEEIKKIITKEPGGKFNITELWRAINITSGNGHPSGADVKRIGRILHRLGYGPKTVRVEGCDEPCKRWVKRNV